LAPNIEQMISKKANQNLSNQEKYLYLGSYSKYQKGGLSQIWVTEISQKKLMFSSVWHIDDPKEHLRSAYSKFAFPW